jgi:hypothetical protein
MQGVRERAQKLFPWRFLNFQVAHPQFKKAQDKILGKIQSFPHPSGLKRLCENQKRIFLQPNF